MTQSQKNWLTVLGTGATAAAAVLVAAPLTVTTGVLAALAFLGSASGAAKTLHTPVPPKKTKMRPGQAVDEEDPR